MSCRLFIRIRRATHTLPYLLVGVRDESLQLFAGSHGPRGVVGGAEVDHVCVRQRLSYFRRDFSCVAVAGFGFGPVQERAPATREGVGDSSQRRSDKKGREKKGDVTMMHHAKHDTHTAAVGSRT